MSLTQALYVHAHTHTNKEEATPSEAGTASSSRRKKPFCIVLHPVYLLAGGEDIAFIPEALIRTPATL